MKHSLAGLEPQSVFSYFAKICAIPHGSRNTKKISDYLVTFAKDHNLRWIQDAANNVIIFKDASTGYEDHEPVILQGHIDMVCQKEEGCSIDMEKEPIDLTHDGTYVLAKGTTLGGDDGVAVALCLAILADDTLVHPPLEVIFTSDEEIGLIGANAIDLSMLRGRRMLNLDTPYDNVFNVGCGGGARVAMELPVEREGCSGAQVHIALEGFHGGHSGSQIGKHYVNTNKALAQLLEELQKSVPVQIIRLSGGAAGNVIPSASQVILAGEGIDVSFVESLCQSFIEQIRKNNEEPNAAVTVSVLPPQETAILTEQASSKVIALLNALPNGVQQWSEAFKNLPLTSLNLGVVELKEDILSLLSAVRSGVNQCRQELLQNLQLIAAEHGCSYTESGVYSAWEYRADSPLRDTLVGLYRQRYGQEPVVRVVHAGLECGVLSEKLPGLDCVSMGPNILEIHTTRERLEIASTQRTWAFLLEILKQL